MYRRMDTPENRKFWASVEKAAAEVRKWPAWKRQWAGTEETNVGMVGKPVEKDEDNRKG